MLTHIVCHLFRMLTPTNLKLGIRTTTTTRISHRRHGIQGQKSSSQGHVISLSRVGPMADKSKTNSRSITKTGRRIPITRATLRTSFKVKRSKIRVTGRLTQAHNMCHIFRTAKPKKLKLCMRVEDIDPHQRQVPWPPRLKVKVTRSHGMSDPYGSHYEFCTWYSLTDNRGDLQSQRSRS